MSGWFFVSVKFDEEHSNTTTINTGGDPEKAIDCVLAEYGMKRGDVLSATATPSTTMDAKKTRVHYAKGIEAK